MNSRKLLHGNSKFDLRKAPYRKPRIDSLDAKAVVRALGTAQAIGGSGGEPFDELPPHPGKRGKKHRGRG